MLMPVMDEHVQTAACEGACWSVAGGGESGVVASVLATTGELARVAGPGLRPHIGEVLPLIIDAIQDASSGNKRVIAVECLGQVRGGCPGGCTISLSCVAASRGCPFHIVLGQYLAGRRHQVCKATCHVGVDLNRTASDVWVAYLIE